MRLALSCPGMDSAPAYRAVVESVLEHWGLRARHVEIVSHTENLVYRAETDDEQCFAVRLHRPGYHTLAELKSEQSWTIALNDAGIAVPTGVPDAEDEYYVACRTPDGQTRQAGLVRWLGGRPLSSFMADETDGDALARSVGIVGELTARLHEQASHWRPPEAFVRHCFDADGLMGEAPFWGPFWLLPEASDTERQLLRQVRERLHGVFGDLPKDPANYSMIHADLHPANVLVEGQDHTIIDFDDAGFGWHGYDMAVSLFGFWGSRAFETVRAAYLEGYQRQRDPDPLMLDFLPDFLVARGLASLGWVHHRREHEGDSARIRALLDRLVPHCEKLIARGDL